jgi:fatty-acyl-CoA synthase
VQHVVLFNAEPGTETKLANVLDYEELIAESDEDFDWRVDDERTAMGLCYTSGTTGEPKGVLYSHRSMYLHTMGVNQKISLGVSEEDVLLAVVPQFHAMAWGLPYAAAMVGAEMVLPGPHLNAVAIADMLASEKVTVAAGVPTIWTALYHELKQSPRDLSHLEALVVGGAAMPRALIEAYEKELGVPIVHAWGMTETSPLGTVSRLQGHHLDLPPDEQWDVKARQGYPVPGVELRIVGETGEELPWDGATVGEVQVRGPWIAASYFKQEPTPEHFTDNGWFRTGDVATMSEDGFMQITDRTKDLVKSGGEWISSVALEGALMAHPKVAEAAVIAIPNEKWSERPCAIVVPVSKDDPPSHEELNEHLLAQFPRFWLPDELVIVDEIPKTSVGKFDKKVLRHRHAHGELG